MSIKLSQPSKLHRTAATPALSKLKSGQKSPVEREGGKYGGGLIRGVAIVTIGEALGHGFWIDQTFLDQTEQAINAAPKGIKARFTHPGLSGDGLGKFTGRVDNASIVADQVRGDLHFAKSAHTTPDGDLAGHLMDLAEEDPEAFGNSIAFMHDFQAEDEFRSAHEDEAGVFTSPDPRNTKRLPHARLADLRAVDAVDSPAANPNGLFHGDRAAIAEEAEALALYALGINETRPTSSKLSVDPDRGRDFIRRTLDKHGLTIVPAEGAETMSNAKNGQSPAPTPEPTKPAEQLANPTPPAPTPDPAAAERSRFTTLKATFPNDVAFAAEAYEQGWSADQAKNIWNEREVKKLSAENEKLKAAKDAGGTSAANFGQSAGPNAPTGEDFLTVARTRAASAKLSLTDAMKLVATERPELYAESVKAGKA